MEVWCKKGWVSEIGKSCADMIDAEPRIYRTNSQKAQLDRALEHAVFHETFDGTKFSDDIVSDEIRRIYAERRKQIEVVKSYKGNLIITKGEPITSYINYFIWND